MCILVFSYSINDVIRAYESGNYKNAIKMGNDILNKIGNEMEDTDIINLRTYLAFSLVAIGDTLNAQKQFEIILTLNNNYTLNKEFVSPKIIKVFEKARTKIDLLIENAPNYYSANYTRKLNTFSKSNIILKSTIIPGWGQFDKNESTKAIIIGSSFLISAISYGVSYIFLNNAREEYLNATTPEEATMYYNAYNNWFKLNRIFLDIAIASYVFNILDVIWER